MKILSLLLLQNQLNDEKFNLQYYEEMFQEYFEKYGEHDELIHWAGLQQESARKISSLEKEIKNLHFSWENVWY